MLSKYYFTYYQPEWYHDDGTSIDYGGTPDELFSFQAFRTEEECRDWLINHDYNPGDFVIHEYCDDEIEAVTLIDANGNVIPKIEDLLTGQVLLTAGSIDNLHATRQSDETEDQFKDRVYTEALDQVNAAIESIEKSGDYDFSSYCNNPDTEWYDEARDEAVRTVMDWMLEDYPY